MPEAPELSAVLRTYPHTAALKSGALESPDVSLRFTEVEPVHKAFAPMARRCAYDLSELAIVVALQALSYGKPIVLLPAVVASRLQRGCLIRLRDRPVDPRDLPALRIGVRAYTQTTGMWVRAHLAEDFGLPIESMRWIARDPSHVAEYRDPPNVEPMVGDKSLPQMLLDDDLDVAILGSDLPKDEAFAPVIENWAEIDRDWYARHGFMPINHLVAVSRRVVRERPDAVRAAYRLLKRAEAQAPPPADGRRSASFGFERLGEQVQLTIDACARQHLLPQPLTVEEVFAEAKDLLGPMGE